MTASGELPANVLFVCTTNTVRSAMAEALLRHLAGHRVRVASAGVRVGEPDFFACAAMREIGIDMTGHQPTAFEDLQDESFDVVLTLSPEAHHRALELTRTMPVSIEYWPTVDATAAIGAATRDQILDGYRSVRDTLFARIKARFPVTGAPIV